MTNDSICAVIRLKINVLKIGWNYNCFQTVFGILSCKPLLWLGNAKPRIKYLISLRLFIWKKYPQNCILLPFTTYYTWKSFRCWCLSFLKMPMDPKLKLESKPYKRWHHQDEFEEPYQCQITNSMISTKGIRSLILPTYIHRSWDIYTRWNSLPIVNHTHSRGKCNRFVTMSVCNRQNSISLRLYTLLSRENANIFCEFHYNIILFDRFDDTGCWYCRFFFVSLFFFCNFFFSSFILSPLKLQTIKNKQIYTHQRILRNL